MNKIFLSNLFSRSSTFSWLSDRVSVQYSQGYWEGELARDQLKFSALPTRPITAEFAVIDYSEDFFSEGTDWQGILGLGYETIAEEVMKITLCIYGCNIRSVTKYGCLKIVRRGTLWVGRGSNP